MRWAAAVLITLIACGGTTEPSGWVELAPMNIARSEHPAVVHQGEIVVLGGLIESSGIEATPTVEAYDPGSDRWRAMPDLPEPRHHAMAAVVGDRLFVVGGFSETGFEAVGTVWERVDDEWVERSPLPQPVGAGAAVTLDDAIWVVGGVPGAGFHRYDPGTDIWETLRGPIVAREHLTAVAFAGEIWAIGGRWQGEIYATVEIYDPETGLWRQGPRMSEPRSGFGAAVVGDSVVVAGGEIFGPAETLDSVETHVAGSDDWKVGEPLPFGLHGNPLVAIGSTVYLPGGSTRAAGVDNAGEMFSLELAKGG